MSDGYWNENDPTPVLAIKFNVVSTNDPCALCGARTDPRHGPELFLDRTWALVCYQCGGKHAPELVQVLLNSLAYEIAESGEEPF